MRHAIIASAAAALAAGAASAQDFASEPGEGEILIEEWTVPWENTRPRDPYTIDGETVWFVGQRADYLGRFDVGSQSFARIDMREGAGPHNVIVDDAGDPWYAGNRDAHIARYDVETGEFDFIEMPDGHPRDPHTQVFDSNGDIWFTGQGANTISKLTLSDRSVETIAVPTEGARPYGIKIAPDGTIWVALLGTNKLASVDLETMALTEHVLPREAARPRRLAITSDGRVWYVDYMEGWLGAFDPEDGSIEEWRAPGEAESRPYAAARDSQDRIWFVETGPEPNNFVGFDPESEVFFSQTPVPSGGGTVRHMQYFAPDGVIWFGADTNMIGRAVVEPAAE
ncbi:lyase [Marinicauda salina]|uniref:Lyase n=1 Tax=Marinicauda salina TaxID=2135793 RepID=A0A2U2BSP6_9PROT|nr:lyase [Marinicauda salina]PWE17018.1 lyase [Marinicauda salina]